MRIPNFYIVERTADSITAEADLTPDLDWFKGHFDYQAIMPGVGQLWLVAYLCREYLNIDVTGSGTSFDVVKYIRTIVPENRVLFCIYIKNRRKMEFAIKNAADPDVVYTTGKCTLEDSSVNCTLVDSSVN